MLQVVSCVFVSVTGRPFHLHEPLEATELAEPVDMSKETPDHVPADEIVGWTPETHIASQRVLEKIGMVFDHFGAYKEVPCLFYKAQKQ
jgi:hypothetical protein